MRGVSGKDDSASVRVPGLGDPAAQLTKEGDCVSVFRIQPSDRGAKWVRNVLRDVLYALDSFLALQRGLIALEDPDGVIRPCRGIIGIEDILDC